MPNINQVSLSGRLVQDPDFQFLYNDSARLHGRITVNRSYRNRNDEWQEETSFFNIVPWQKAAETFARVYVRAHRSLPPIACRATPGATMTTIPIRASQSPQVRNLQILEKDKEPPDGEEIEAEAA